MAAASSECVSSPSGSDTVTLPSSVACWAKICTLPQQKYFHDKPFPLVLSPVENTQESVNLSALCAAISSCVSILSSLQLEYGALYFRGFPLRCAKDFDDFVSAFQLEHLPYVGGAAVRNRVVGNVYTTNESPADQLIPFHHEMAQVPIHPKRLFFFCETPPLRGGETPLLLSAEVYSRTVKQFPQFISDLENKGVRYVRVLPELDDPSSPIGRGWKSTFLCESKEEAETKCTAQGSTFQWINDPAALSAGEIQSDGAHSSDSRSDSDSDNGSAPRVMKTISAQLSGIRLDERTGKKVFFNSIVAAHRGWKDRRNDNEKAVIFGDGSSMDSNTLRGISTIMDQIAVAIPWQTGDVAFIDNITVMHSRNHFEGARVIYAALMKT